MNSIKRRSFIGGLIAGLLAFLLGKQKRLKAKGEIRNCSLKAKPKEERFNYFSVKIISISNHRDSNQIKHFVSSAGTVVFDTENIASEAKIGDMVGCQIDERPDSPSYNQYVATSWYYLESGIIPPLRDSFDTGIDIQKDGKVWLFGGRLNPRNKLKHHPSQLRG